MIYILIVIVNLIFGLATASNRVIGFFSLLGLGWLIASDYVETNVDYYNYSWAYNNVDSGITPFEKGYTQLELLAFHHGLSYVDFRWCFTFTTVIILFFAITRFTSNVSLFVALFSLTVFFTDGTQIRNLMMISLVMLAASFLKQLSVFNVVVFLLLVYLSTQIHSTGYPFFAILMLRVIPYDNFKKLAAVVFAVVLFISVSLKIFGSNILYQLLVKMFGGVVQRVNFLTKLQSYTDGTSLYTVLLIWMIIAATTGMAFVIYKLLRDFNSDEVMLKAKILFSGMSMSLVSMPLIVLAPDYSRISRNATLFLFALVALYFEVTHREHQLNSSSVFKLTKTKILVFLVIILVPFSYIHNSIWGSTFLNSIPYTIKLKSPYLYSN